MLTTVTMDGTLRSRPMLTLEFDDEGQLWFFSSDESGKAHDLEGEKAVNLAYADPERQSYVSITGLASVVQDRAHSERLWQPRMEQYLPGGLDNPHLVLIRVQIEAAEYWDFAGSAPAASPAPGEGDHAQVAVRKVRASG